ncbi:Spo7-like protein-domain-containing protein [Plectosphaerella plurivora]|uniref:Spo7-like protein-domain-containing protein n=1 Tax=Plectosphaerella plurivora TaxID=936078 RepID=A0A9P8V0Z6_9PEZI|nr:Spo7-like protein-domain-containing protein [Plectosphaerella plurivora]
MADRDIDSLVKGAPAPGKEAAATERTSGVTPATKGDPLNHAPSSPSMIYLNLLVLEASLRAQYLELRARRRHHAFFLTLLTLWICGFGYALFFAPREDGQGVGGSVYWGVETIEKLCFMGGVMTAILVWATGIWDRGIRWPRRWFAVSNRGLRGFNCKLVIIRRPLWAEIGSSVGFFLTYGLFSHTASSSYRYVDPAVLRAVEKEMRLTPETHPALPVVAEDEERGGHEEDLAPGGDYVKLLLLAKPFTPTFRENWEIYRTEYWEKENERRAVIRLKLKDRERELARQRWGLFWWLPWRRNAALVAPPAAGSVAAMTRSRNRDAELDKLYPRAATIIEKSHRRRGSSVRRRSSTSSSRSPTPGLAGLEGVSPEEAVAVSRKASTASTASDKKRRNKLSTSGVKPKRPAPDSRSVTPDIPSPLAMESAVAAADGEAEAETEGGEGSKEGSREKAVTTGEA